MRRFTGNPVCGTKFASFGPIHARIGPLVALNLGRGTLRTLMGTVIGLDVERLEVEVAALRQRGVAFEDYDFPGLRTEDAMVDLGDYRAAWFRDSDNNIIMLAELIERPLSAQLTEDVTPAGSGVSEIRAGKRGSS